MGAKGLSSSPYVHAALLLHLSKQTINEENLKKVLSAAGVNVDEARVKALVSAISEVNIDEAIKTAAAGFVAPTAAPAPQPSAEAPKEKEKEKREEEKKKEEEEALSGLSSLFG